MIHEGLAGLLGGAAGDDVRFAVAVPVERADRPARIVDMVELADLDPWRQRVGPPLPGIPEDVQVAVGIDHGEVVDAVPVEVGDRELDAGALHHGEVLLLAGSDHRRPDLQVLSRGQLQLDPGLEGHGAPGRGRAVQVDVPLLRAPQQIVAPVPVPVVQRGVVLQVAVTGARMADRRAVDGRPPLRHELRGVGRAANLPQRGPLQGVDTAVVIDIDHARGKTGVGDETPGRLQRPRVDPKPGTRLGPHVLDDVDTAVTGHEVQQSVAVPVDDARPDDPGIRQISLVRKRPAHEPRALQRAAVREVQQVLDLAGFGRVGDPRPPP